MFQFSIMTVSSGVIHMIIYIIIIIMVKTWRDLKLGRKYRRQMEISKSLPRKPQKFFNVQKRSHLCLCCTKVAPMIFAEVFIEEVPQHIRICHITLRQKKTK
ncbi:MAG: hypothetical protein JW384_02573 [Nitrosomonadaceae bacterium]|nr:hypothetical protein [Nitrosomonadaceae bacterium]